jgi:hypothetical protein
MEKTKLVFVVEHLGLGDGPEFLLRRIQELNKLDKYNIHVIEWTKWSDEFQSLRNQVITECGINQFWNLGDRNELPDTYIENRWNIRSILQEIGPDIIHFEDSPENFDDFPSEIQEWIYSNQRPWRIVESSHDSTFEPTCAKQWEPDAYSLIGFDQFENQFSQMKAPKELIQFPIDALEISDSMSRQEILGEFKMSGEEIKHIVNIGPLCPSGNQEYLVSLAQEFLNRDLGQYQFHLVGPLDPEFEDYWSPLVARLPENVKIWGEQVDTWKWLRVAEVMLHTSIQDIDPIAFRLALANGTRILGFPLRTYRGAYAGAITEITGSLNLDTTILLDRLTCGCKRPGILKGQDGIRFQQQVDNLYTELLGIDSHRIAVEQSPNQWSVEWLNGPRITNLGTSEIQVTVVVSDVEQHSYPLAPTEQISHRMAYSDDIRVYASFVDGSSDSWKPETEGKDVAIIWNATSLEKVLAGFDGVCQWLEEHKTSRCWIKTPFADLINWDYYKRKYNLHPIPEETTWYPDIDMTIILEDRDSLEGEYLGQNVGNQLGIKVKQKRPFLNLRPVGRPHPGKYIVITTDGDHEWSWKGSWDLGWQEVVDYHVERGWKVYLVGDNELGLTNVEIIKGGLKGWYNALQWCDYLVSVPNEITWLAWTLGKPNVVIHEEQTPSNLFNEKCLLVQHPDGVRTEHVVNRLKDVVY